MEYIDKIFVINLNGNEENWNRCLSELKKYKITNYERFIFNIPEFKSIKSKNYKNFSHNFLIKKKLINNIEEYIRFEYAIKMAHLKIIDLSIKKFYNEIIILEDAFAFKDNFNYEIDLILKEANKCYYGLLYLSDIDGKKEFFSYTSKLKIIKEIHETLAYSLSNRLFNIFKKTIINSDCELNKLIREDINEKYSIYLSNPDVIKLSDNSKYQKKKTLTVKIKK